MSVSLCVCVCVCNKGRQFCVCVCVCVCVYLCGYVYMGVYLVDLFCLHAGECFVVVSDSYVWKGMA